MLVLLCYDIGESQNRSKVLNRVHNICKKYLFSIQNSVFIGEISRPLYSQMISELVDIICTKKDKLFTLTIKNKNNAFTRNYAIESIIKNIY
jgi:CRISPR-associated protein Cas2